VETTITSPPETPAPTPTVTTTPTQTPAPLTEPEEGKGGPKVLLGIVVFLVIGAVIYLLYKKGIISLGGQDKG
jgi:hypothetical protein